MAKREGPPNTAARLQRAGKLLHDEIGPLLSAAGLRLQLIRMDYPETTKLVSDATAVLDQAIDSVRELSRALSVVPGGRIAAKPQADSTRGAKVKKKSK